MVKRVTASFTIVDSQSLLTDLLTYCSPRKYIEHHLSIILERSLRIVCSNLVLNNIEQ